MGKNKDDHIYNLCYGSQMVYFLDDSSFQDDHSKVDFECGMSLPKISEMSDHIEEYNNYFLDESDYGNGGIISIQCSERKCLINKKPKIKNKDESSVFLSEKKVSLSEVIKGQKSISFKYVLSIDISKSFEDIIYDLNELELNNPTFSLYSYLSCAANIKNDKHLKTFISGARLDVLESTNEQFMMVEYYYLRKFANATITQSRLALDKIYNLSSKSEDVKK